MSSGNEKLQDKKLVYTIVGVLLASLITPFILEWVLFRNNIYSAITNGEWASFLGSFLGGVIGGIGTLMAVYFTTNQTRKIQKENEEKLEYEIKLRKRKERKEFTDEIATLVSKYIADVKRYDMNLGYINDIENEIKELKVNLHSFINYSYSNDKFNINVESIENQIDRKIEEKKSIKLDRVIADECYNLLMVKLANIDKASGIIKNLNYTNHPLFMIDNNLGELRNITNNFINNYIDDDENSYQ